MKRTTLDLQFLYRSSLEVHITVVKSLFVVLMIPFVTLQGVPEKNAIRSYDHDNCT